MEEQLKKQREALHAKRIAEASKSPATSMVQTSTISTPKAIPIISQSKGVRRIFTSRGTTPTTARPAAPSFATVRTPQGQTFRIPLSVLQGKPPGQPIIIRSATPVVSSPQQPTPVITSQIRTPTAPTTYVVRTSTSANTLRPIILSNQIRPQVETPTTQPIVQRQVQVPLRLPDGRMQIIQIPLSAISNNQPIQIAINTQPASTSTPVIANPIQIMTANTPISAQQTNTPQLQTPQIRIISNTSSQPGQPMVAKVVQVRPQTQQVGQTQQVQIQAPQQHLNQILTQQIQSGKIQVKLNAATGTPTLTQLQTSQTLGSRPNSNVTIRIEPKAAPKPESSNTTTGETSVISNSVTVQTTQTITSSTPTSSLPITTATLQSPQFVVTSEITQEIVRQALMNPNVAPEIQQKLMALQRHHQENKDDHAKPKVQAINVIPISTASKSRPSSGNTRSSRTIKVKEKQSLLSPEQREEQNRLAACQAAIKSILDKIEKDEKNVIRKQKIKESLEEKRQKQSSSKLQVLLFKHAEALKRDIVKKRALLEKDLKIEVQDEISTLLGKRDEFLASPAKILSPTKNSPSKKSKENVLVKRKISPCEDDINEVDVIRPPKPKRPRPNLIGATSTSPKSNKTQKNIKSNKLYCVCRQPYDASRFMVGCDSCSNWFHVDCVGLTEVQAKKVDQYLCPNCSKNKARNTELYCLCRQPYDDSQFYICCDRCQDWFHGRCVGVLQSEADQIDEYICPNCQEDSQINYANLKALDAKDCENLKKLLKSLQVLVHI